MIRINLMPPEFRKRRAGSVSPVFVSVVAGGGAVALVAAFWLWLWLVRVPLAEDRLAEAQQRLSIADAKAKQVEDMQQQIADIKQRADQLDLMLARKVYWVAFLDDFADLLGRREWSEEGYEVACTKLSITPTADPSADNRRRGNSSKPDDPVFFQIRWSYQLVGRDQDLGGDYIRSFFESVEQSDFWQNHGMTGRPIDSYSGDKPEWVPEIQRLVIEEDLEFTRRHVPVIDGAEEDAE